MASYRKEKLEELIKRIIAEAFLSEIKDPRIGFVTITGVELSRDYSVADVGVSIIGDDKEKKKSMMGIESASGYIQHIVSKEIKLRSAPKIKFHIDTSIEEGVKLVGVIEDLDEKGPDDHSGSSDDISEEKK